MALLIFLIPVVVLLAFSYVKAPPNKAYIISGPHKQPRILIGKAGFRIPLLERLDTLDLGTFQIDVKTSSSVPTVEFINIRIDSTVAVKVSQDAKLIQIAAQNFLNTSKEKIAFKVNDLLEGNLREIAGSMKLTDMVNDRKAFSEKVQENAVPDLARLGLELVSFNVQNFVDDNGVIDNLGIDNVEQIRKQAVMAKSDAEREIAIREAENLKAANDVKAKAAEEIAIRNTALEIRQAELKRDADTQRAIAEAALSIEAENQRKVLDVAATDADIAKAEREADLRRKEIELREYELDALVRKQADADKYAAEQKAEAQRIAMEKEADAKKYAAIAEAEGIAAKGAAEAEAIRQKAEAQKQMGEASILEMFFSAYPQAVANAAAPLTNVEKIVQYGDGNSAKMVKDVTTSADQIMESLSAATGIDVKTAIASFLGAKSAN